MKVTVHIRSGFSAESGSEGVGECFFDEGRYRIDWIQPAAEGEALGAKYVLTFDKRTNVLLVDRYSGHISRMAFCEGVATRGELQTTEGNFETEIFTHLIKNPGNGIGRTELRYDLLSDGQEPISNTLVIDVFGAEEKPCP